MTAVPSTQASTDSPIPCVLLVEDEMLLAMMLESMLTDLGYRILKVARVAKALQLAATAVFDCAILDVNLDGESSYPIAKELRRRGIPFVFSTGYSPEGLLAEYRDSPVLLKPYTEQNLQSVLANTLQHAAV